MILRFRAVDKHIFDQVRSGAKRIETRAATPRYRGIQVGETLTFACGKSRFAKRVTKVYHWPSVEATLSEVPLKRIMPDLNTHEDAKARYASYPGYEEKINRFGIYGYVLIDE